MRVGIDFDNTIARYDEVFAAAARTRGWVPQDFVGTKKELRDAVRLLEDGEIKWQMLQGEVYGLRMAEAVPFAGFTDFLRAAHRANLGLYIVSHKTRYSNYDPHRIDLRQAALRWLEMNRFFDPAFGLSEERVFFEDTRERKIERLNALGCKIFIDDLEEVFVHPDFPKTVKRILFTSANNGVPSGKVVACRTWQEISRQILNGVVHEDQEPPARLFVAAERLAGAPVRSVRAARASGNNRLFRVETAAGDFALKTYFQQATDTRDRLTTEYRGLGFLRRHGVSQVPQPIAADPAAGLALYEWIDGEPAVATPATIDAALDFVRALEGIKGKPDACALPLASEACLCPASVLDQVEHRLAALQGVACAHPDLQQFLQDAFVPTLRRAAERAQRSQETAGLRFDVDLDPEHRCLSPSDFGFHNVLVERNGRAVFLDFEYFGWDDPVKMTSDFLLHPGMELTAEHRQRFLRGACGIFRANPGFEDRLRVSLPLYALRWTMILLNEFLPDRWRRRVLAGYRGDRNAMLRTQLRKAQAMLGRMDSAQGGVAP